MLQTKALKLLSKLDASEFKGFLRFLQSPVFNKNNRVIALYDLLKKYYPAFDSPKVDREKLYAKLYPKKKYSYQQFANLISDLTRLVEEYYSHLAFKADTFQQRKLLIQSYRDRDLYELFEKEIQNILVATKENKDISTLRNKHSLLYDFYFHPLTLKNKKGIPSLNLTMESLDEYYFHVKLLLAVEMRNRERILNEKYNIPLINEIQKIAEQKKDNLIIYSYSLLLNLIKNQDENNFTQLKNFFFSNCDKIDIDIGISIFRILNNHCLVSIRNRDSKYALEHLSLYKFGIEKKLLLVENKISVSSFMNAVTSGILCNRIDWVKGFIDSYKNFLETAYKKEILLLANANIEFTEKNFNGVLDLLTNIKPTILVVNINMKSLIIRSYFELFLTDNSYYELLISSLLSFEKYIQRTQEFSNTRIKPIKNFIHYMKKIINIYANSRIDYTLLETLLSEIEHAKSITSRNWFLSRFER